VGVEEEAFYREPIAEARGGQHSHVSLFVAAPPLDGRAPRR
jgi:hypothetical protein